MFKALQTSLKLPFSRTLNKNPRIITLSFQKAFYAPRSRPHLMDYPSGAPQLRVIARRAIAFRFAPEQALKFPQIVPVYDGKVLYDGDTYYEWYDYPDHRLVKSGTWLRTRNGKWELKALAVTDKESEMYYPGKDLTEVPRADKVAIGESEVRQFLQIPKTKYTLYQDLKQKGITIFTTYHAHVKGFSLPVLNGDIWLESTDFGYHWGEIGFNVYNKYRDYHIEYQGYYMDNVADDFGIDIYQRNVRNGIEAWVEKFKPELFKELVDSGLIVTIPEPKDYNDMSWEEVAKEILEEAGEPGLDVLRRAILQSEPGDITDGEDYWLKFFDRYFETTKSAKAYNEILHSGWGSNQEGPREYSQKEFE